MATSIFYIQPVYPFFLSSLLLLFCFFFGYLSQKIYNYANKSTAIKYFLGLCYITFWVDKNIIHQDLGL